MAETPTTPNSLRRIPPARLLWWALQGVVVASAFLIGTRCPRDSFGQAENYWVGRSAEEVIGAMREPDREFAGHYGAPPLDFTNNFAGEIRTLFFQRLLYETYASFEKRPAGWICIGSSKVLRGTVF
jgi:hypothetical protein